MCKERLEIKIDLPKETSFHEEDNVRVKERFLVVVHFSNGMEDCFSTNKEIEADTKFNIWKERGYVTFSELNEDGKYAFVRSEGELPRSRAILGSLGRW
jgi:hypothetical protein